MTGVAFRVSYLLTRGLSRPQRAFRAAASNLPIIDIIIFTFLGLAWVLAMEFFAGIRTLVASDWNPMPLMPNLIEATTRYGVSLAFVMIAAVAGSMASTTLGGRPRLFATLLAYILAGVLAFGAMALPIAVIRLVDHDGELSSVSGAIVAVAPWIYLLILLYNAQIKIHKTVPNRAVAYLGLSMLPLLLVWSALMWWNPVWLPPAFRF